MVYLVKYPTEINKLLEIWDCHLGKKEGLEVYMLEVDTKRHAERMNYPIKEAAHRIQEMKLLEY